MPPAADLVPASHVIEMKKQVYLPLGQSYTLRTVLSNIASVAEMLDQESKGNTPLLESCTPTHVGI